jgi:flagellar protein FliS
MSYSQANVYREREVLTASPEKLVVITFDHVLVSLRRARVAIEANNIERRVEALSKAREGVMELLMSVDTERGGPIADNLLSLYSFAVRELFEVGRTKDTKKLDAVLNVMTNLREAFAAIAADPTAAAVPAA